MSIRSNSSNCGQPRRASARCWSGSPRSMAVRHEHAPPYSGGAVLRGQGFASPATPLVDPDTAGRALLCDIAANAHPWKRARTRGKHPFGRLVPNGLRQAIDRRTGHQTLVLHLPGHQHRYCDAAARSSHLTSTRGTAVTKSSDACEAEHGPLPPTGGRSLAAAANIFSSLEPADPEQCGLGGSRSRYPRQGGYVVAPPSLHESGRRYEWNVDAHPDETPLAAMPDWLEALASKSTSNGARPTGPGSLPPRSARARATDLSRN